MITVTSWFQGETTLGQKNQMNYRLKWQEKKNGFSFTSYKLIEVK